MTNNFQRFPLLSYSLKGNVRWLLLGAVAVVGGTVSFLTPMVTGFLVDFVLRGDSSGLLGPLKTLADRVGRDYFLANLWVLALALLLVTGLSALFNHLRGRFTAMAAEGIALRMRSALYTHLQDLPYDYHKHTSTGDLVQRCSSDVAMLRRFIGVQMLEILRTVVIVAVALSIMAPINGALALASTVTFPVLIVCSGVFFKKVRAQFTLADEAEGRLSTMMQENYSGVRVVRAFGQQKQEIQRFRLLNSDYQAKSYRLSRLLGAFWGISDGLGYLQIFTTMMLGIYFCVKGELTVGNLMIFTSYTSMMVWPVRQLGRVLSDFGKATVSLGRLEEIMSAPVEKEPGRALTPEIRGRVEFREVCFGYDRPDDVLKGVSFTAEPGQTVAILGSTGSGKSSLVQLMQRLYRCTSGGVYIDGVNVDDIERHHLRRNIGIVLQEPFLYSRTIAENIKIVRPDASEQEMRAAAATAAVDEVIMEFKDGYDTMVGERGVTLSGGQKQRVAIARMLMQQAPIIIFDDSMSAVDTETDRAIREALRNRRSRSTTFIISHRITTLCEADFILVLENGRVADCGTHSELMSRDGLYRRIADIQTLAGDEEVSDQCRA